MKKAIKLLSIAAALAMIFTLAACNKNDSETEESSSGASVSEQTTQETADPIVGKWQSKDLPDYIYTFNADGTGQYDMAGNILDLTYTTEEGKITISFTADGYTPVTLSYELDGDRLNIKDSYGKDTFYIRVKE